jgi:hypothetical protein
MRKIYTLPIVAVMAAGAIAVAFSHTAQSADHLDSPSVLNTGHSQDIADVYTWMDPTGKNVILAMTVDPTATKTSVFDNKTQYVFHTSSGKFSPTALPTNNVDVIAMFDSTGKTIQLWVGTAEYVTGDASKTTGLESKDQKVKVFAGPRADAFYFNLDGYHKVQSTVEGFLPSAILNEAGCPINVPTAVIASQLSHASDGGAPSNFFDPLNELAIVVEIDKTLLTAGGTDLAVSGATYK